jgi:hypothetical protein
LATYLGGAECDDDPMDLADLARRKREREPLRATFIDEEPVGELTKPTLREDDNVVAEHHKQVADLLACSAAGGATLVSVHVWIAPEAQEGLIAGEASRRSLGVVPSERLMGGRGDAVTPDLVILCAARVPPPCRVFSG